MHPWQADWAREIEERTGGAVKITILEPGQHPFKSPDYMPAVRDGLSEMAWYFSGYAMGTEPLLMVPELLWILGGPELEERSYIFETIRGEMYDPVLDRQNQVSMLHHWFVGQHFDGNKFFLTLDDFKGVTFRTMDKAQADMIVALGAKALTLAWGDIYPALERGIVEGTCISIGSQLRSKFFEEIKYITRANYNAIGGIVTINKGVWNELPKDLQDTVMEVNDKYAEISQQFLIEDDIHSCIAAVDEYGVQICHMPPALKEQIREIMKPLWYEWAESVGPDAVDLVDQVLELHDEWQKSH